MLYLIFFFEAQHVLLNLKHVFIIATQGYFSFEKAYFLHVSNVFANKNNVSKVNFFAN